MDNELSEHDPYRGMQTGSDNVKPDFSSAARGNSLGGAEAGAINAISKKKDGIGGVKNDEKNPKGLFSGKGKSSPLGGGLSSMAGGAKGLLKGKGKLAKISAGGFAGLGIAALGLGILALGTPIYLIGAVDGNLKLSLGFDRDMATLEEQATTISEEQIENGKVPRNYFNDLAKAGIDVGQVTANGEFVRTNTYIANIDELDDVAAVYEDYNLNGEGGELSVRFGDKIIRGSEFAEAVKSDPKMYAAFSDALDIKARFYYSDEVRKTYEQMGVSRHAFAQWESTGDAEQDKKNYDEILKSILDKDTSVTVAGGGGDMGVEIGKDTDAEWIVEAAGDSASSTAEAAQMLNAAVSAEQPYKSASAFMSIVEPIERTMIVDGEEVGSGPVHETMDMLQEESTIEYTDAITGETKTYTASILGSTNFAAAVSDNVFDRNEAASFSRDKILKAVEVNAPDIISDTAAATENGKKSGIAVGAQGGSSGRELSKALSGVSISLSESSYELMPSVVGANNSVMGGAFIRDTIASRNMGGVGSDEDAIMAYYHATEEYMNRKIAAERATKSPFDLSSKNTFFGSIAHGLATNMLKNSAVSKKSNNFANMLSSTMEYAGASTGRLFGSANADGSGDTYMTIKGDCDTVKQAGIEGDLYCNGHTTVSTKFINYKSSDWEKQDLEDEKEDFVVLALDREVTEGIESATICEQYRDLHSDELGLFEKLFSGIADLLGIYNACKSIDSGIANGSYYSFTSDSNNRSQTEKLSGYVLYDTVKSLLSEEESDVSKIRKEFYSKHPMDNSPAGRLARRSGMTKDQAQIAINYSNYLTRIAKYNPVDRIGFGTPIKIEKNILVENNNKIAENAYYFWREKILYSDLRNRNFVV